MKKPHMSSEDPFHWVARAVRKIHSLWLAWTYPFDAIGHTFSAHPSCDLRRTVASYMRIGNRVLIERNVRLDVPLVPVKDEVAIVIDDGAVLGQRVTILAINRIHIERNTIFAASVLVTDHNHSFDDVNLPISQQGGTKGGTVRIEEGCWIGFGVAIIASEGDLVIGKNSVIGANSLVTRSVPPYSVVTGNPARVVKHFDLAQGKWLLGSGAPTGQRPGN